MTNPTPHGQVPEALRLAEEISNLVCSSEAAAKTIAAAADELCRQHTRIAELEAQIEALSGVPALSAAPEAIAKLRHLYQNMVNGAVRDTASAKRIAEGLLAPAIEALERATPPAEQPATTKADATTGAALGVEPGAVYAELPAPTASIGPDDAWHEAAMRDFADRTHTLRMQAAPKAAPGEPMASAAKGAIMGAAYDFRDAHISGSMNLKRSAHAALEDAVDNALAAQSAPKQEVQEPAKAAPGVGNSGFDHQTAADFLNGKTVSDEAARKFVQASRWAHDERAALSATLLAMHGVLASREAEIALLKKALLEAEAAHQPAPAPLSEMPYEKRKAIQEGEQIGASDAWFRARFNMLDTLDRRNVFRAGFDRGWHAAIAAQGGK